MNGVKSLINGSACSFGYPQPEWLGVENIAGKILFLHWEQGLGDTIQFCRYARLAEARGARVIMEVQQPLYRLLRQISPTIQIIGQGEKPAAFDYHCPLLSLPLAFGTTLATIPAAVPYYTLIRNAPALAAAPRRVAGPQGGTGLGRRPGRGTLG